MYSSLARLSNDLSKPIYTYIELVSSSPIDDKCRDLVRWGFEIVYRAYLRHFCSKKVLFQYIIF